MPLLINRAVMKTLAALFFLAIWANRAFATDQAKPLSPDPVSAQETSPNQSNLVVEWNFLMMQAIRMETTGPTLSTRNLAILNCAIYDAVNSITRTHKPYLSFLDAPAKASMEAAVTACGHEAMRYLYPSLRERSESLYRTFRAKL